jgi:hypothetical protein
VDPAAVTPDWLRFDYAWNSRDGKAWVSKNGMGDGEYLYVLYVRKKHMGVYGSAAEAKAAYEQG